MQKHSKECKFMIEDGYTAIFTAMSERACGDKSGADKNRLVSNIQAMASVLSQAPLRYQEEEKDFGDNPFGEDLVDLSGAPPKKKSDNNPFQENGGGLKEMDWDMFMEPAERQRADTYMKQMQQEIDERLCKFCNKQITEIDQRQENVTFLQTTDCFH